MEILRGVFVMEIVPLCGNLFFFSLRNLSMYNLEFFLFFIFERYDI